MLSYDRRKTFPFSAESYSEIAKTRLHGRLKTSPKLETTEQVTSITVSYTHLTLPTILRV